MKHLTIFISIFIISGLLIFSACTSKKPDSEIQSEQVLTIEERVRPTTSGGTSAAYFTYTNNLDVTDTLISVQSTVAGLTQVHESYTTEDGMMGMREQQNIVIEPNQTLTFEQGGLHVMMMQLTKDLISGDSVVLELKFSNAGQYTKTLPVKN